MRRHPTSLDPTGSRNRKPWLVAGPLAAVFLVVIWLLAFGLTRNPDSYRNPLVGRRAPAFALRSLQGGGAIRLAQLRGQIVLVNFWGSWCNDCVVEHAALDQAWRRYRDQGVVVLGVVYQDTASNAERFLHELG